MARIDRLFTHSGRFHADEVFATAVLRALFPAATLERTREEAKIADALEDPRACVYDVGGRYEPGRSNLDHHQRSFSMQRRNGVTYAAFGLVWREFGTAYVAQELADYEGRARIDSAELARQVDDAFIAAIDAGDNGEIVERFTLRSDPETQLEGMTVHTLIAGFNPGIYRTEGDFDRRFADAVDLAGTILENEVRIQADGLVARDRIEALDDGSPILVLEEPLPWKGHTLPHHAVVISPTVEGDGWVAQVVPNPEDPFRSRFQFPSSWAGRRGDDLQEVSGVDEARFCHRKRFVAGAWTLDAMREMARQVVATAAREE